MVKKRTKILAIAISSLVLFGCAQNVGKDIDKVNTDENLAGIVLEGADEQKNIKLEDVKSIELYDLEGRQLERLYTEDYIKNVVEAWNASSIDDTAYIEMIAGYRMVITLEGDKEINITSYGNKDRIVATVNDITYHLICPEIGEILLDN